MTARVPGDAIDGYLGKIVRVFSRHWGVNVVVGGAGGLRTDLGSMTIYVPETAACLADSDRPAFEGALDHEVGHVRAEVDFPEHQRPSTLMRRLVVPARRDGETGEEVAEVPDRFRLHLFNLCEDVRLEASAGARWHGCKTNLDALRAWAAGDNRAIFDADPEQLGIVRLFGLGFFCRALGTPEMADPWLPFPVLELLDAVQPFVDACATAETPLDTLEAAQELARILEELAEPLPGSEADVLDVGDEEWGPLPEGYEEGVE